MSLLNNIIINIYSILILIIIYQNSLKHDEKESMQYKLYMMMLQLTILMLVIDIFSRFDGKPDTVYFVINNFGNFLIFILNPILPSLWLLYAHLQVFQEEEKTKRLIYPLLAINALNAIMVVLTQFFGWFYYIDSDNIYHRGPLFLLSASITVALVFSSFVIIIANCRKIEKKYCYSLMLFAAPPFVCIILQIIFYGISIVLNGVVLSLLIAIFNIQNHSIYTDYLTGVNNRKKLEIYLEEKISTSTEDKTFSAILIDLNNFKSINDTYGHNMGDYALQIFAKLLKNCLRSNDFIARFGGDEFCAVLDICDRNDLEDITWRINTCIEEYNESGTQPYKLGLSMGYAVYDYNSGMGVKEFIKEIDTLMYKNKHAYKKN